MVDEVKASGKPIDIVNEQAKDDGLWFMSHTAPEAYLQQELRKLHKAVEIDCAVSEAKGKTTEEILHEGLRKKEWGHSIALIEIRKEWVMAEARYMLMYGALFDLIRAVESDNILPETRKYLERSRATLLNVDAQAQAIVGLMKSLRGSFRKGSLYEHAVDFIYFKTIEEVEAFRKAIDAYRLEVDATDEDDSVSRDR